MGVHQGLLYKERLVGGAEQGEEKGGRIENRVERRDQVQAASNFSVTSRDAHCSLVTDHVGSRWIE